MPKRKKGATLEDLQAKIRLDLKHWKDVYRHGTQDPTYTDGDNLDLIRRHVIHGRSEIKNFCKANKIRPCPAEAKVKLPRVVPRNYCAPRSKAGPCVERRKKK